MEADSNRGFNVKNASCTMVNVEPRVISFRKSVYYCSTKNGNARSPSSFLPLLWPRPRNDTGKREKEEGGRGLLFPLERRKQKPSARKDEQEGCVLQKPRLSLRKQEINSFPLLFCLFGRERASKAISFYFGLPFPRSHIEGEGGGRSLRRKEKQKK